MLVIRIAYKIIVSNGKLSCSVFSMTLMIRRPIFIFYILLLLVSDSFEKKKLPKLIKNSYYPGAHHVRLNLLWAHLFKKTIFA